MSMDVFKQIVCGCDCTIFVIFAKVTWLDFTWYEELLEINSKPVRLNAAGQWNLCISLVCCEELEQCDLLAVPSSPPVLVLFIDVPAASSNFLSQASKSDSIFSWKKLRGMLVWTRRASSSQHAQHDQQKKRLLSQASSVSAGAFSYLFGKVRII